jgi:hypothetical protein
MGMYVPAQCAVAGFREHGNEHNAYSSYGSDYGQCMKSGLLLNAGSTKASANRAASIPKVEEEPSGSPESGQLPLFDLFCGILEHGTLHQMSRQMQPSYVIQGTQ